MTIVKCVCGNDKTEHKGVLHCPHCDTPCTLKLHECRACRHYHAGTNARVNAEYEAETRRKLHGS